LNVNFIAAGIEAKSLPRCARDFMRVGERELVADSPLGRPKDFIKTIDQSLFIGADRF